MIIHVTIYLTDVYIWCKKTKKAKTWQEHWLETDLIYYMWSAFERVINGKLDETDMLQVILT